MVKNLPAMQETQGSPICLQCRRRRFSPWGRKIPWRRKWQPTPVFLPGKSHGQRSLVGYSHWVAKNPTGLRDYTLTYFCQKTNSVADAREKSALYLPREGLTTVPLSSVPPGPCGRRFGCQCPPWLHPVRDERVIGQPQPSSRSHLRFSL